MSILAGGCMLGSEALRREVGDSLAFWVPQFALPGVDPSQVQAGDLIALPPSLKLDPRLAGLHLRVVARRWAWDGRPPRRPCWSLLLLCADADPAETDWRYRSAGDPPCS